MPLNTVNYFESVRRTVGAETAQNAMRLFMVPGMQHCSGGEGTDSFDMVGALDRWVEQGQTPDRIEGSRVLGGAVVRTRPLCAYPQVARYDGTGSTDQSGSFTCGAWSGR